MDLCDIREIKQIMNVFHLNFKKEFGQNFLTDRMVVEDIADMCCDYGARESTILEIGPGIGTLSCELAKRYRRVVALEIDTGLIPVLKFTMGSYPNFTVVNEDVMKADLDTLLADAFAEGAVSVCANLPYYITTPVLMYLLESGVPFSSVTVMVQKEVADRITARAGSSEYGAITAAVAYYGRAEKLFTVSPGSFLPAPKVESAVMRITIHEENPYEDCNRKLLFDMMKAAFEQRRKTLSNTLRPILTPKERENLPQILEKMGFPADVRGEKLDVSHFATIARGVQQGRVEK